MVEQDNKFNNIKINDEICVETIVFNQSMHFEGTLVSIDDENIELLSTDGKNFKIPKTQIVNIKSEKNTPELESSIRSESDEDQIDIDDKDYCGCIIYDIDFSIFELRKVKSDKLTSKNNAYFNLLNWGNLFLTDIFKKYFETTDFRNATDILSNVLDECIKDNRTSVETILTKLINALSTEYKTKDTFSSETNFVSFVSLFSHFLFMSYMDLDRSVQFELQDKIRGFVHMCG